ncbi:alpha/beta hydrolase [Flavisolibacter ginsenosidimutans]|uniref:Alpha/beta hydrolase n=1 Tax=Flavisolibacter ginsenosidimutans TaxID=661481 RepID=A0A5B8UG26_9BACT|nr:alpha/beta hydrolase [Flavisolibacter ginsenosidimutans]QEC55305.1 alpha/beta hydrolase [Flavisolibacter ginsenosidimutans]
MKLSFSLVALLVGCVAFSQGLVEKKDVVYGKAPDWHNRPVDLRLDLFYPTTRKNLPLIVFLHGGGFIEGWSKSAPAPFCKRLAESGFVVANVDYRAGFNPSPDSFRLSVASAVYRAQQDQKAALHYLIHHAADYPINTAEVFLAGESAGGVTSLFSAYVSQGEWDQLAPPLHSFLGSIDSAGNELHGPFLVKGVISLWGGIADTSLITKAEAQGMPVLLFHSEDDELVPFERSAHSVAENQLLQGSRDIANRFKNNNACYQLYFIKGAAHAYGFSPDYLISAIRTFVAAVGAGKCSSTETENKGNTNVSIVDADADSQILKEKILILNPNVLEQYAGEYKGGGGVITIRVDGYHLTVERPGEAAHELYPVKPDVFVDKKLHVQTTFTRDAQGAIIEYQVLATRNRISRYQKIK